MVFGFAWNRKPRRNKRDSSLKRRWIKGKASWWVISVRLKGTGHVCCVSDCFLQKRDTNWRHTPLTFKKELETKVLCYIFLSFCFVLWKVMEIQHHRKELVSNTFRDVNIRVVKVKHDLAARRVQKCVDPGCVVRGTDLRPHPHRTRTCNASK